MNKRIIKALFDATQTTIDQWSQKIKENIQGKAEKLRLYEQKKQDIIPMLLEAHEQGVSSRELGRIMGINHTTIAKWIRQAKAKEKQQEEKENSNKTETA